MSRISQRSGPEKKFLIKAPVIGEPHYWMALGRGNTPEKHLAYAYGERQARQLCEKEPLLEMIPA